MSRILITGAAGFVGANLCERLVKNEDNYIIALDNLYTGFLDNFKNIKNKENFEFIEHDIINPISLKVDMIYNLACPASPYYYQKDPLHTTKTCVFGILNMLELAKENNARILHASTSEVYGNPLHHPQVETDWGNVNPNGVRSCYDEGKRCAESIVFDHNRMYGTDVKVIRIFNTYGPMMNSKDGRVVSNFIVQALKGEDLTVYGDGTQTRSFCYIDDLIEGIIRMMEKDDFKGPLNLGNPGEFTMLELAEKVLNLTNSKSKIVFNPLPEDDPERRRPDISLAKRVIGWEPRIKLEEGLKKTIEYFNKKLTDSNSQF